MTGKKSKKWRIVFCEKHDYIKSTGIKVFTPDGHEVPIDSMESNKYGDVKFTIELPREQIEVEQSNSWKT